MYKQLVIIYILAVAFAFPKLQKANRGSDEKIVGGNAAIIENYPYQASLQFYESHICGGSIISNNYVVTAGHCTNNKDVSALTVRAGASIRERGGVVIQVAEVSQHPEFNATSLDFDVSVLKLASPLTFGKAIKPIRLQTTEPTGGENAVVTGWGLLSEGGDPPSQLQTVTLQIVSREDCQILYDHYEVITNNMICADAPGKDTCQGDSGGPVTVNGVLTGIVSWTYGCARPEFAGVYSNVVALRSYIIEHSDI